MSHGYQEAEKYFKSAISLAPDDPSGPLGYAQVLMDMGKLNEAKEMLQKAQSLDKQRKLTSMIDSTRYLVGIKAKYLPQLKEIGWA